MPTDSKDEALDLFEQHRIDFLLEARDHARRMGADGRALTVDDIRTVCPPPTNVDPRVMGAVFRQSEWTATGFVNSSRRTCHKRPVRQFVLTETINRRQSA